MDAVIRGTVGDSPSVVVKYFNIRKALRMEILAFSDQFAAFLKYQAESVQLGRRSGCVVRIIRSIIIRLKV